MDVLFVPIVFAYKVLLPMAVLLDAMFVYNDWYPIAVLFAPLIIGSALIPNNVFVPTVLPVFIILLHV